jgi:hypothetical protein
VDGQNHQEEDFKTEKYYKIFSEYSKKLEKMKALQSQKRKRKCKKSITKMKH